MMRSPLFYRRITELSLLTLFFGGLAALGHETAWLENTLDLGIPIAVLAVAVPVLMLFVYRYRWLRHASLTNRWRPWVVLFVSVASLVIAGTSYFNRISARPEATPAWVISSKAHEPPRPKSPEQWKLLLTTSNESHWVSVSSTEWTAVQVGQPFPSQVQRGSLGVRFVSPPGKHSEAKQ
jgi:hypothetical protein